MQPFSAMLPKRNVPPQSAETRPRSASGAIGAPSSSIAPPDGAFYIWADIGHLTNDSVAFCAAMLAEAGIALPGLERLREASVKRALWPLLRGLRERASYLRRPRGSDLRTHVYPSGGLLQLLRDELPARTIEDLQIPFQCVAASVERAVAQWFTKGPLAEAVLAEINGRGPDGERDGRGPRLADDRDAARVTDTHLEHIPEPGELRLVLAILLDRNHVERRFAVNVAVRGEPRTTEPAQAGEF